MTTPAPYGFYIICREVDHKQNVTYGVLTHKPGVSASSDLSFESISEVLTRLADGQIIHTATFGQQGGNTILVKGARVHAVPRIYPDFISTDPNATKSDNLSRLPSYRDIEPAWLAF